MIPVLFTSKNSLYLEDPRFDCYGEDRDAMTWTGTVPAIYHPPCRLFSVLKGLSNAGKCEKFYGYYSIMSARRFGGIVEHPNGSTLFKEMGCDLSGKVDQYGGFLRKVNLSWFGFPAEKQTLIYIKGCRPAKLPAHPISFNAVEYVVATSKRKKQRSELQKKMRSQTPQLMIDWFHEIIKQIEQ